MENEIPKKKVTLVGRFILDIWKLLNLTVVFGFLYSMIATIGYRFFLIFSGEAKTMTFQQIAEARPAAIPGIVIHLPDPVVEVFIICIVTGVITYIVTKWVCQSEWVREKVKIKECWEEVKWYNPFSWFVALVCTIVEVFKWVLKTFCSWVEVLVTALVVLCIVGGIILVAL